MQSRLVLAFFTLLLCWSCHQDDFDSPTNVIIIITDDQGYGDVGRHGNPSIRTPHLDTLYDESIRFTNYHSATTCAPTRAGLLTGVNCNRAGAWHTIVGRSFLNTKFSTIADILGDNGYATGIFGKWHLGDNHPYLPQQRGFSEVLIHGGGGVGQTPDYWGNDYFDDVYFHNGEARQFSGFCTDIWFEEAIGFMRQNQSSGTPFFTYISTNTPHDPHYAPQEYIDMYDRDSTVNHASFYGQISNIDDNLGRLESFLKNSGLKENTLLIYTTDNGTASGASLDQTGHVTRGYNYGMRGKKGSKYEGGHRVPLIMRFPRLSSLEPGNISILSTYTDLFPTILSFLNIKFDLPYELDGSDLMPAIEERPHADLHDRIVIVDTQRRDTLTKYKDYSIMQGSMRLVDGSEYYDLRTDPGQRTNIADRFPQEVSVLQEAYEQWWQAIIKENGGQHLISIGHEDQQDVLLICHDWHTEGVPPWHQFHIRQARVDNGYWDINIEAAGQYRFRLYRWPPSSQLKFNEGIAPGEPIPGGRSFPEGIPLEIQSARIEIQDHNLENSDPVDDTFFEFIVSLDQGPSQLKTFFDVESGERGAYYVEATRVN